MQDVENYWFDLQCVCLNTPLGTVALGGTLLLPPASRVITGVPGERILEAAAAFHTAPQTPRVSLGLP